MNGRLQPFERGMVDVAQARANVVKCYPAASEYEHEKLLNRMLRDEIYLNREYQVNLDRNPGHGFGPLVRVIHLSIKRRDKRHIHDWRDLQAIKNMLIGEEYEAIELYPAESRLIDEANQYHLWVFTGPEGKPERFPLGTSERQVNYSTDRTDGSRQRGSAAQEKL